MAGDFPCLLLSQLINHRYLHDSPKSYLPGVFRMNGETALGTSYKIISRNKCFRIYIQIVVLSRFYKLYKMTHSCHAEGFHWFLAHWPAKPMNLFNHKWQVIFCLSVDTFLVERMETHPPYSY